MYRAECLQREEQLDTLLQIEEQLDTLFTNRGTVRYTVTALIWRDVPQQLPRIREDTHTLPWKCSVS